MADVLSKDTVKELINFGRTSGETRRIGNTDFVVIPQDCKVVGLSDYVNNERAERPIHRHGLVKVHTPSSFCEYYGLFADVNSRVFADETKHTILAVLDYHGAGSEGAARWGKHRIDWTLKYSEEWQTWTGSNGVDKKMSQADFAEFIEDNGPDVIEPSTATMLELARDLSAKTDVDFASSIRMQNGSVQLKFNEQVKGTFGASNTEVPERFKIAIPVYVGGDRVQMTVRLRWRVQSARVTFWYDLLRASEVERGAFISARKTITDTLQVTVIDGTPA